MDYLGKVISLDTLLQRQVDDKILVMKTRNDYHRLCEIYNWNRVGNRFHRELMDRLTNKQWHKVYGIKSRKYIDYLDKASKVTKNKKLLDKIHELREYIKRVEYFQSVINPEFGFNGNEKRFI